ncbi:vitelline membrane outer layer protein 1-like [Daphnia magna]|uniref:vitelline membrane outer layer protein 1-like n=1 Tax=Daphnia magna TaxID=35525 RepID=UPI001E1BB27C|nr:vitelline membrane outer layer protein 1-like [Daphnia magna]
MAYRYRYQNQVKLGSTTVMAVALVILCCSAFLPQSAAIYWGDWGTVQYCPSGSPVVGFSLKTERPQGRDDDTALNGIAFKCLSSNIWITSSVGPWGGYGRDFICPTGTYITQCQLRVESRQGSGDDTAANNLNCKCSNNDIMNGDGTEWGGWMAFSQHCSKGICGLKTRVERSQGSGDDTALNDAKFLCC